MARQEEDLYEAEIEKKKNQPLMNELGLQISKQKLGEMIFKIQNETNQEKQSENYEKLT